MARILIAEDEPDIRDLITFTLRYAGHEVIVESGAGAGINYQDAEFLFFVSLIHVFIHYLFVDQVFFRLSIVLLAGRRLFPPYRTCQHVAGKIGLDLESGVVG